MTIYLKEFSTKKLSSCSLGEFRRKYEVGGSPTFMKIACSRLIKKLGTNFYLLCAVYKRGSLRDCQLGITGSLKERESFKVGCIREMGEEIGLNTELSRLQCLHKYSKNDKDVQVFSVNYRECEPLGEEQYHRNSTKVDHKDKKVGCLIYYKGYGPKVILKKINNRYIEKNEREQEELYKIALIPIKDVLDFFEII